MMPAKRGLSVVGLSVVLLALLVVPAGAEDDKALLKPGDRLAILGDSITEQKLYSKYIETYLTACRPELRVAVLQLGWSGETAPGFVARMENDLMWFHPTLATTCYGMNDGGYAPYNDGTGKRYGDAMRQIVERLKKAGCTILVGSPGPVGNHWTRGAVTAEIYNQNLATLGKLAKAIADENGMPFADIHTPMQQAEVKSQAKLGPKYHVCGSDGVHPWANGQLVMAYAFLKQMHLPKRIGTITVDYPNGAIGSDGQKILSAKDGAIEIESTRYPFCFTDHPGHTRSILPFVPFNDDLNEYVLIVKNLPFDRVNVTWGKQVRTFSKAQLEHGVNLAAEFLDNNPFGPAFDKVMQAVAAKQAYETNAFKHCTHIFPWMLGILQGDPKAKAHFDALQKQYIVKYEKFSKAARDAVQPVRHTLRIAEASKKQP